MDSSALRSAGKTAARSAIEAAAAGVAALAGACWIWRAPGQRLGLCIGGACAWAASSVSVAGLLAAKARRSTRRFWWAFGAGMTLRLLLLVVLMAYGYTRETVVSQSALLLAYSFGVLSFLLLEYRHIKLK
jgi:hypothetical protein